MTIDPEFLELMPDIVTLTKAGDRDGYGDITYAQVSTSHYARVIRKQKVVRSTSGDDRVSGTTVWVYGAPGIDVVDRLTLPDGTSPVILAVEHYTDEDGPHHEKVFLA